MTLWATGGGDNPEAHNLVFHNSYNPALGGPIGWRSGSRKFVVVISDAQPHGNLATQGFTGCSDVSADPHGLVTSTELAGMAGAERTLLMIHETDVGDSATLVIDGITQDEPVNGVADGNTSPDGFLSSPLSNKAKVRAERAGTGDGRVYRLHFTATDTHGGTCSGTATVGVPHDKSGAAAVDSAPPSYNSLLP